MQIEYLSQEVSERIEDFIERVENRINEIITPYKPEHKLIDITWFCDNDSYYPYSCILTFYIGHTLS